MKKICICTTVSITMKTFLVETAKYLHENCGYDITLICNEDEKFEKSLPEYLHFIPVHMARGIDLSALKSIKQFMQIFKEHKFDMVQYSTPNAACYFLWLRYKQEHPSGYQYTQFCHYFNQYVSTHHGSQSLRMAVERVPGERVYIDWVGDQPELLVDSQTGELRKVHIFVTTVGVSSMIYAEAFPDEKLPNFIAE